MHCSLLIVIALVCTATAAAAAPPPAVSCNLNGYLASSAATACTCYPAWQGPTCARLAIQPVAASDAAFVPAYGFSPNVTSWGGNVLRDDNGTWHLFVSEMAGGCGLSHWSKDSQIVHAVSTTGPMGPFTRKDVSLPVFAHNASPLRVGQWWYIFHIGSANTPGPSPNCSTKAEAAQRWAASASSVGFVTPGATGSTTSSLLHRAASPTGPWEPLPVEFGCNNPAPLAHANGSLYVGCGGSSSVTLYRTEDPASGSWTRVIELVPPPSWNDGEYLRTEDPYLYIDARGIWHLLAHVYDYRDGWPANPNQSEPVRVSGHAFSTDGLHWTFQDEQPYDAVVTYEDGTHRNYSTFERPHVVFDGSTGEPTHLVNGVSPVWLGPDGHPCSQCDARPGSAHSCVVCKTSVGVDWTYTLVQPLGGGK